MDEQWLQALGHMPHGIYLLTTHDGEEINGMIASWVSQVSYAPPLVLVAVHPDRYSHGLIEKSGTFALHILATGQKDLLKRFKGPDPSAKFRSLEWFRDETGCPISRACVGYVECVVRDTYRPGNHSLFVGEVVNARHLSDQAPLTTLDYEGCYTGER